MEPLLGGDGGSFQHQDGRAIVTFYGSHREIDKVPPEKLIEAINEGAPLKIGPNCSMIITPDEVKFSSSGRDAIFQRHAILAHLKPDSV